MKYSAEIQTGYYDDDDTYHGPFIRQLEIEAKSLSDAIGEAMESLRQERASLLEPENMTQGDLLSIQDSTGRLLFHHALGRLERAPAILLKALLIPAASTEEGLLIEAVAQPWFDIMKLIRRDPMMVYEIDPRAWEEIIAGAYTRAGFEEVILTPRSGDKGRDVIATRKGVGSIRIFDQVKAYRPGHVVTAEEVRAMIGVVTAAQNVSKGVVTTTSDFAPRLLEDVYIKSLVPYRLELKPRDVLLPWLAKLAARNKETL